MPRDEVIMILKNSNNTTFKKQQEDHFLKSVKYCPLLDRSGINMKTGKLQEI